MSKTSRSVFAITCNQTPELRSTKFFNSLDGARKHLKKLSNERKNKLGVKHFKETSDSFSFVLGWEGHEVYFTIIELAVEE